VSGIRSHTIDGVQLQLAHPVVLPIEWVGREELRLQLLAAWLVLAGEDVPLTPRLTGKPGVGKTTLAYAVARSLGREVYLLQATMDTRPEDLIVTPVIGDDQKLRYVASPVVTAMLRGGVAILDEGNRMSEKSWASLAPLLDARRYVESIVAGIRISAHPDFRLVATMNQDASTFDLPEYIHSRLQPQILIDFPDADEERLIMKRVLPFANEEVLDYVVSFLQLAHAADERYTVRDGINIARYALKSCAQAAARGAKPDLPRALADSVQMTLGAEALRYLQRPGEDAPVRGPRGPRKRS
jgi:MoxR-like ATPase